jgi:transcriptional regulator with XRE-family HTH domain
MTKNFSSSQLRAARGLMNMSLAELAKLSGVSKPTIHRIETEAVQPHEKSLKNIMRVFEAGGVEFTDDGGVRPQRQSVEVLVGVKGLCKLFDYAYEHTKEHGGTILQIGFDETFFIKFLGEHLIRQKNRMAKLAKERGDFKVQSIISEGDTNFFASEYKEYRWLAKDLLEMVPFYLYGDCLGIMTFQTVFAPTIILIKFPAIALAYRKQFEVMWRMAKVPPGLVKPKKQ